MQTIYLFLLFFTPLYVTAHTIETVVEGWLACKQGSWEQWQQVEEQLKEVRASHGVFKEAQEAHNYYWKERDILEIAKQFILFPINQVLETHEHLKQKNLLDLQDLKACDLLSDSVNQQNPKDVYFSPIQPNGKTLKDLGNGEFELLGGVCSSASLIFLHTYTYFKEIYKTRSLSDKVQYALDSTFPARNGKDNTIAIIQAAMNTIGRKSPSIDVDTTQFRLAKVDGLARFFDMKVETASTPFYTSLVTLDELKEIINNLEMGTHLLRIVRNYANEKGEKYGHTLALIKEEDVSFFFDANLGTLVFFPEDDLASFIMNEVIYGRYAQLFTQRDQLIIACFYKLSRI